MKIVKKGKELEITYRKTERAFPSRDKRSSICNIQNFSGLKDASLIIFRHSSSLTAGLNDSVHLKRLEGKKQVIIQKN